MKLSIYILFITLVFGSCINKYGISYKPHSKKTIKREATPSLDFNSAFFQFRKENGYWPKKDFDMRANTPKVIDDVYSSGFERFEIIPFSKDTAYIFWTHQAVTKAGHIGIVPIAEKQIFSVSEYIFSSRYVKTKITKAKQMKKIRNEIIDGLK